VQFARMLAKIAHAFAYSQRLLTRPEESAVVPAILGRSNDVGRWVGTASKPLSGYAGTLHRLAAAQGNDGSLIVESQLFADSETPTYEVVLRQAG
jgi:hypothetical protein